MTAVFLQMIKTDYFSLSAQMIKLEAEKMHHIEKKVF